MIAMMPLPFASDALAPHVSAETFDYHHGKHFVAYVAKTNELIADTPLDGMDLEGVIAAADAQPGLFNAAAQAWNHGFFWASLTPRAGARPGEALHRAIVRDFGSFDAMAAQFVAAGAGEFGSGWAWLVATADGRLQILSTHDAMPAWVETGHVPLLVCDVWEHAYYIDWRNDRGGFLAAFINGLANWAMADAQYHAACHGQTAWRYPG